MKFASFVVSVLSPTVEFVSVEAMEVLKQISLYSKLNFLRIVVENTWDSFPEAFIHISIISLSDPFAVELVDVIW